MSPSYFQVGGFNPDVTWTQRTFGQESQNLAAFLGEDGSPLRAPTNHNHSSHTSTEKAGADTEIELILGITKAGTSHLLLSEAQMGILKRRRRPSWLNSTRSLPKSGSFESLSPIRFRNVEDLTRKLDQLKPKKSKQRDRDTSTANLAYDRNTELLARGAYEHGRVVYHLLNGMLYHSPETYGLEDLSWSHNVQVCSFVYNTWGADDRIPADRRRNPIVLDYGYSSARLPTFGLERSSIIHMKDYKKCILGQSRFSKRELEFSYGETLVLEEDEIKRRLRSRFNDEVDPTAPMILLVFKAEETIACLNYNEVDTSEWRYGIRDLIMGENRGRRIDMGQSTPKIKRRSASPDPRQQPSTSSHSQTHARHTYRSSRDYGETRPKKSDSRQKYAPVYVVDIHDLYRQLTNCPEALGTVGIARRFLRPSPPEGWCAGNEACLLIDIWRKMITGMAIDEQREFELQNDNRSTSSPVKQEDLPENTYSDDDDEERDPNEVADAIPPANAANLSRQPEDDSDEGDSDDVSD
ncbi:hypothetical protein BJ165DRAFT_1420890 [Panaeolus papilionaceus]|nr:hypothetical protein BJ165DRAFT_1420890 [Panaeolus papilionaceus]